MEPQTICSRLAVRETDRCGKARLTVRASVCGVGIEEAFGSGQKLCSFQVLPGPGGFMFEAGGD